MWSGYRCGRTGGKKGNSICSLGYSMLWLLLESPLVILCVPHASSFCNHVGSIIMPWNLQEGEPSQGSPYPSMIFKFPWRLSSQWAVMANQKKKMPQLSGLIWLSMNILDDLYNILILHWADCSMWQFMQETVGWGPRGWLTTDPAAQRWWWGCLGQTVFSDLK